MKLWIVALAAAVLALPVVAMATVQLADIVSTNGREIYVFLSNTDNWQRAGTLYFTVDVVHPKSGTTVETYSNNRSFTIRPGAGRQTRVFLANYAPKYSGYKARIHLRYTSNKGDGDLGTHEITLQ